MRFYKKDEATNFNADVTNNNNFKSFEYKTKLLGNTEADGNNGILKNETISVPLKYLSKWTKYCILCAAGANDNDANSKDVIFTVKDTKLYVPVVTLSARDNQKLSKLLSKGFERSGYWNEYKTKSENKNTTNEFGHFLESNFVGVNRLFLLVYSDQDANSKRFKTRRYHLLKGTIDSYNVSINGKNFYDPGIDSDIKPYEEIRKWTAVQGEGYTTECLLDYGYIKNHYRLIAVDLSRQKELDTDPKAIHQIEFVGQLGKLDANYNAKDAGNDQSMFVLTILGKIKESKLKFSQGSVIVL